MIGTARRRRVASTPASRPEQRTGPAPERRTEPLPSGFRIVLDDEARELAPGLWFGGQPARVLRLTDGGRTAWAQLRTGAVSSRAQGLLARRLTDAGLAHPVPPDGPAPELTVVIPVHGRPDSLDRCLTALGRDVTVFVVDDASADEFGVRAVASRYGAHLVRLEANVGPGPARDAGLRHVRTEFVAFVDSDTTPRAAALLALAAHFADPTVAVVAPRVVPAGDQNRTGWAARYAALRSPLDLGTRPGQVRPYTRVSYLPTAALLARCSALAEVAVAGAVFDPALRYGEDVDLVWRLYEAGWRQRYEPAQVVGHAEPTSWPALLRRRFRYGSSGAPLARRHSDAVAPFVVSPWLTASVVALLARRPVPAALAFGASWLATALRLRRADVPRAGLTRATFGGLRQTWLGMGRYAGQFGVPLLIAVLVRGRAGARAAAGSLLLGPPLTEWYARRNLGLGPLRYSLAHLADDSAYGAGVIAGCVRHHTTVPLRPILTDRRRLWPTRGSRR